MGKKMRETLGIVVWANYSCLKSNEKLKINTLTSKENKNPRAFPIDQLKSAIPNAVYSTSEDFSTLILTSSDQKPLIIPLKTAEEHLGWEDFDIPPSFLE